MFVTSDGLEGVRQGNVRGEKRILKNGKKKIFFFQFPSRSIHKLKNFQTIAVIFKAEEFPPL